MALWPAVSTVLAAIVAVGCSSPAPASTAVVQPSASVDEPAPQSFGYTNQRSDGNRVAAGAGSLLDASPLDIALDGVPVWAVAAPSDAGLLWVAGSQPTSPP